MKINLKSLKEKAENHNKGDYLSLMSHTVWYPLTPTELLRLIETLEVAMVEHHKIAGILSIPGDSIKGEDWAQKTSASALAKIQEIIE